MDNSENNGAEDNIKSLVKELADDYSSYFKVDTTEAIKKFDNSIEENLVLLEDFCAILDVIRNENTSSLAHFLPGLMKKSKEMEALYSKIDQLELFVKTVKDQVNRMEEELIKAEQAFASGNKVKKFIASLLMSNSKTRSPVTSPTREPTFGFNDIFKTQDYITDSQANRLKTEIPSTDADNQSERVHEGSDKSEEVIS